MAITLPTRAWTHSWELDPYLLFLSYLFTYVVCQILSWSVGLDG